MLEVYFANYTEWGPQAEEYLNRERQGHVHVHMGAETHLRGSALKAARRSRKRSGYKSYTCPAVETGRGGTTGGTWILVQRNLASHGALPGHGLVEGVPQTSGDQWTAAVVRVRKFDILFMAAYLDTGVGLSEGNINKLNEMAMLVRQTTLPFVILADWNLEPSELLDISWPGYIGGEILTPRGVEFTCSRGKGRMLDFAVVSHSIAPYVKIEPDFHSPWKPHLGIRAVIELEIQSAKARVLLKPKHLGTYQGPVRPWSEYLDRAKVSEFSEGFEYPADEGSYSPDLTYKYGIFSRAAEFLICDQANLGGQENRFLGRGAPAKFKVVPSQATNGPMAYTLDPDSNYWAACHSRLSEYLRFRLHHTTRGAGASGHPKLVTWFRGIASKVASHFCASEETQQLVKELSGVSELTIPQLSALSVRVKSLWSVALGKFQAKRRKGFSLWLQEALKNGLVLCIGSQLLIKGWMTLLMW